jgi:Flp pilus assembly protein TadG
MTIVAASTARRRRQAGQAMVEFGLVATLFLLLLFGIMDTAYAVFCYNSVASAAREAVRYAVVHGPKSPSPATTLQIQQVAVNAAPGVNLKTSDVTVTWPADPNLPLQDAQVRISFNYQMLMSLTLTSSSRMVVSQ